MVAIFGAVGGPRGGVVSKQGMQGRAAAVVALAGAEHPFGSVAQVAQEVRRAPSARDGPRLSAHAAQCTDSIRACPRWASASGTRAVGLAI